MIDLIATAATVDGFGRMFGYLGSNPDWDIRIGTDKSA